jgi:hypothetical protein
MSWAPSLELHFHQRGPVGVICLGERGEASPAADLMNYRLHDSAAASVGVVPRLLRHSPLNRSIAIPPSVPHDDRTPVQNRLRYHVSDLAGDSTFCCRQAPLQLSTNTL